MAKSPHRRSSHAPPAAQPAAGPLARLRSRSSRARIVLASFAPARRKRSSKARFSSASASAARPSPRQHLAEQEPSFARRRRRLAPEALPGRQRLFGAPAGVFEPAFGKIDLRQDERREKVVRRCALPRAIRGDRLPPAVASCRASPRLGRVTDRDQRPGELEAGERRPRRSAAAEPSASIRSSRRRRTSTASAARPVWSRTVARSSMAALTACSPATAAELRSSRIASRSSTSASG